MTEHDQPNEPLQTASMVDFQTTVELELATIRCLLRALLYAVLDDPHRDTDKMLQLADAQIAQLGSVQRLAEE